MTYKFASKYFFAAPYESPPCASISEIPYQYQQQPTQKLLSRIRTMEALKIATHSSKTISSNKMTFSPSHIVAISVLVPTLRWLYIDYHRFLALGPGGTPKTVLGYLKVKMLSVLALQDPYAPPNIPSYMATKTGRLSSLPQREGPRPTALGIAPHRQIDQRAPQGIFDKFDSALRAIAAENENVVEGTSCFEKHGPGLFSSFPQRRTCKGEICHAHPSDGSMHLTLHPADARIMLEAGWGERHPLARGGWLEQFVPGGFVMVYAPRDEGELRVVLEIVRAAAWFVGGDEIKSERESRRDSATQPDDDTNTTII